MHKAFTLIELMVVTAIIAFLAAISGPALSPEINRANLNAASTQIRDLISETQTYAMGPEQKNQSDYLLVLNFSSTSEVSPSTGPASCPSTQIPNVDPRSYGIFSIAESNPLHTPGTVSLCGRNQIKSGLLQSTGITSYSIQNSPYPDSTKTYLAIYFRTNDYAAGFDGIYYDYSNPTTWNNLWDYGGSLTTSYDDAVIVIKGKNQGQEVRVNKITGRVGAYLCNDLNCDNGYSPI